MSYINPKVDFKDGTILYGSDLNASNEVIKKGVDDNYNRIKNLETGSGNYDREIEELKANKADKTELATKADKTALNTKADKTELETKANKSDLVDIAKDIDNLETSKADKTELSSINNAIKGLETSKADKTELSSINKSISDLKVNKADKSEIPNLVEGTNIKLVKDGNKITISSTGGSLKLEIVDVLPTTGKTDIIYLVPKKATTNNVYDEYIYINNKFELIGSTEVDLTDYYNKTAIDGFVKTLEQSISNLDSKKANKDEVPTYTAGVGIEITPDNVINNTSQGGGTYELPPATTATLGGVIVGENLTVDKTGKLNATKYDDTKVKQDITNLESNKADKSAIPTKTSDLTNDSNFITSLPNASSTTAGVIKVGTGLNITDNNILNGITEVTDKFDETILDKAPLAKAIKEYIDSKGSFVPLGTIVAYPSEYKYPTGWEPCEGQLLPKEEYQDLFDIIGYTYGGSPEDMWFGLPDLEGKVIVGQDINSYAFETIGQTGGEINHKLTVEEMPSHSHNTSADAIYNKAPGAGGKAGWVSALSGAESFQFSRDSNLVGGNQPHNNLQPYMTLIYIMKVSKEANTNGVITDDKFSVSTTDALSARATNARFEESRRIAWKKVRVGNTETLPGEVWFKQSKNLIKEIKYHIYYHENQGYVTHTNFSCTGFIEIKPNKNYIISGNNLVNFGFISVFDEKGKFLSRDTDSAEKLKQTFSIKEPNAKYIVINFFMTDQPVNFQLEEGTTATSYEPYVEKEILTGNGNGRFEPFLNAENLNAVTLFEGSQGDMNTEIILNDYVQNYSRIIVEGHNGDNWHKSVTVDNANEKWVSLDNNIVNADGVYTQFLGFKVSGNKIIIKYNYDGVNRANQYERYAENRWKIIKVLGYK